MGRVGLNYNYIPAGGWVDGSYDFKLQLKLDGKPYAASPVKQLEVSGSGTAGGGTSPAAGGGGIRGMNPYVIGGIVAGVVAVAVVVFLFVRMSRRY